jgi:hypothetical protein
MRRLTIEEAEHRCPDMVKGQRWNNVEYKYWFICKIHGKYLQSYMSHQSGYGCDACGGSKDLDIKSVETNFPEMVRGQKWIGAKAKYWFVCNTHGKYLQRYDNHYSGQRCDACGGTKDLNAKEVESKHLDMIKGQKWLGNKAKYWFECKAHGKYLQTYHNHDMGKGCSACAIENRAKKRSISVEEAEARFPDIVKNQRWNGAKGKYWFVCTTHGNYKQRYYQHQQGNGCPRCQESKGEKRVAKILVGLNVQFSRELRISECRDKRPLPFDFSVDLDKKYLIEFHGGQHYKKCTFFGGNRALNKIQNHDRIKRRFCKRNDIPLLVIKHTEKNMEEKIRKFLKLKGAD